MEYICEIDIIRGDVNIQYVPNIQENKNLTLLLVWKRISYSTHEKSLEGNFKKLE